MPNQHPRIRAAAIIVRDDKVLLARHEKEGRSYWVLPGGGVKFGETVGEALVRELREESGFEVRVGELVLVNDSIPPDHHRHIVNLYFRAEITGGALCVGRHDTRLRDVRFLGTDEIPGIPLYPDIRDRLYEGIRNGFSKTGIYLGNLWNGLPRPTEGA